MTREGRAGTRYGPPTGPADHPRLFVAVPIPKLMAARIADLVAKVQDLLGPAGRQVRWVQMEGLHVTLRFVGPTRPERVEAVAAAVDRAASAVAGPFDVRLGGAGAFPDAARPRALWLGITTGAAELGRVADEVAAALLAGGWDLEERPFRPHLTIARTDGVHAGAEAGSLLVAAAAELDVAFTADRVVLYRSHLGRGPARYEALHAVPLGRG